MAKNGKVKSVQLESHTHDLLKRISRLKAENNSPVTMYKHIVHDALATELARELRIKKRREKDG